MITGQHGMTTLVAEAENPLREWDVLDFVKVRGRRGSLFCLGYSCIYMHL